ncbi:DEAD/DEAH box helicase [Sodalis ligni]|uniref:RAD3-like DEAD/DEAH box helicase n=1 Tax=Sodalis ligni TaxID=2697027 RepID=A0A4R1NF71_9GAMM|nr:DEAD/DEAH box helicase [Sodalis ligni]TCL06285.1 RAD3-like DEAD/DEAH box helicase [Sodalis ligni]
MANNIILDIAQSVRQERAGPALLPIQAKLYSQQLRLEMSRPPLTSFSLKHQYECLNDAILLVECGLIERDEAQDSEWRSSLYRAAQIVEWLSNASLRPQNAPLHLISAAIYQVADLPAMALGHLNRLHNDSKTSVLLSTFLRGDFPAVITAINNFWKDEYSENKKFGEDENLINISLLTEKHIVMCIGTICAYLKTGNLGLTQRAILKLKNLAKTYLHSRDPYSYLLARLIAITAQKFVENCLWPHINNLKEQSSPRAGQALVQFAHASFISKRALVWPAQAAGIKRLLHEESFVLCTPTGSGKTTIATLGVIQGLFADGGIDDLIGEVTASNLVLYLVPSRALAAEVEQRLSIDLMGIDAKPVIVTGLYGGIDWGPTDAWVQHDDPAIVICTFEKADALIRYLGILFLDRVRLVVIDEAHMVNESHELFSRTKNVSSRSLHLEQLGMRLLQAQDHNHFKIIALSAVAAQAAPAMARWLGSGPNAEPVTSNHRSTRQMIGKLEVSTTGKFSIRYALMDGQKLVFDRELSEDTPYVPSPFAPMPSSLEGGPDIRMRAPTLWSALNLAQERNDGLRPAVLISITQNISPFAKTCADLMDHWQNEILPNYSAIDVNDSACVVPPVFSTTANEDLRPVFALRR